VGAVVAFFFAMLSVVRGLIAIVEGSLVTLGISALGASVMFWLLRHSRIARASRRMHHESTAQICRDVRVMFCTPDHAGHDDPDRALCVQLAVASWGRSSASGVERRDAICPSS
jgi:hypothetical protein